MLVRDDARSLPGCIDAVRPHIHSWTIVDTGSTDGTPKLVEELLGDLPGHLHVRPWRDFGANRTELVELAAGSADYLLLLDADQVVGQPKVPTLTADAYFLQELDDPEMWVPRLLRDGMPWRFVGATHEQLVCDVPFETKRLAELVLRRPGGRARTPDELERDRAWLERDLGADPGDHRAAFSLAQTYRDLGRDAEAVELYARCAEGDPSEERAFCAAVQAGAVTARSDPAAAVPLLLAAWGRRPTRVEPLLHLARAARQCDDVPMAVLAARTGAQLDVPDDRMFVHRWMYEWGIRIELALALAELGSHDDAVQVVDELLDGAGDRGAGEVDALAVDALSARQLLLEGRIDELSAAPLGALPLLADLTGSTTAVGLGLPEAVTSSPGGASIGIGPQGFTVAIHTDGRTFLQIHDADGSPVAVTELTATDLVDVEDARVVWWRDAWHLVVAAGDAMALVRVDGDRLVDLTPMAEPDGDRGQRSWMPFVEGDRLRFVAGCAPFVVVEWDPDAKELREVERSPALPALAGLQGASPGVPLDAGHLFVVQQVHSSPNRSLHSHRLLHTDATHRPVALSPAFALQRYGPEQCRGLAPWGDELLLSFGTPDHGAWLMSVPAQDLRRLLRPLEP